MFIVVMHFCLYFLRHCY